MRSIATGAAPSPRHWRGLFSRGPARRVLASVTSIALGAILVLPTAALAVPVTTAAPSGFHAEQYAAGQVFQNACSSIVTPGEARCLALVRTNAGKEPTTPIPPGVVGPSATNPAAGGAYAPAYLRSAYNAPSMSAGSGETVAVIDAYDDPSAASDLAAYRSYFGLPPCSVASGCFTKVNQRGATSPLPSSNASWAQEISLDLDMVSAICPACRILLVEASSAAMPALGSAVNEAVALGAVAVSNSYGAAEYSSETTDATTYFDHPGVAITASAGDSGYGAEFPASSPLVTAVGGTTLNQLSATGTRNATETVWSNSGSGCSAFEPKPTFQRDSGCTNRTVVDVAAVADPNTGVWVYDSFAGGPWDVVGGTSVAAPIVASFFALAGTPVAGTYPNSYLYADPGGLNDITSGSNGSCHPSYLCTAGPGYDGPSGLGTPNGIAAFTAPPMPPGPPQHVAATPGDGKVALAWTPPSFQGTSPVTGYDVYRATSSGSVGVAIATNIAATTFTDSSATNGTQYFYEIAARNAVGEGAASSQISAVAKARNAITITSTAPVAAIFAGSPYQPSATASSGDAVSITSVTAGVCQYVTGSVSFVGTGTCTLHFDDPGNAVFAPAPEVTQSFLVGEGSQGALAITSTTGTFGVPLTLATNGGSGGGALSFVATDATATGCEATSGVLTSRSAGICLVTATKAQDADYAAVSSSPTPIILNVLPLAQTIRFSSGPPTGALATGSNNQFYSLNATGGGSNNPVMFHIDAASTSGCSILNSTVAFGEAPGSCVIDADQQGSADYLAAAEASQSFQVAPASIAAVVSSPTLAPSVEARAKQAPIVTIQTTMLRYSSRAPFAILLHCAGSTCTGSLLLSIKVSTSIRVGNKTRVVTRSIRLGSVRFLLDARRSRVVRLRFRGAARRLLSSASRSHRLRLIAEITTIGGSTRHVVITLS